MRPVTTFALLLCLFDVLQMNWAVKRNFTLIKKKATANPMHRALTNNEVKYIKPTIKGISKEIVLQSRVIGQVNGKRPTIIGGKPAPRNMFPWMCNIAIDNEIFCGGSVISPTFVLTAANCVFNFQVFILFMGSINSMDPEDSVTFESHTAIIHPEYDPTSARNDIAIIELPYAIDESYITMGKIVPIRLPSRTQASKMFAGSLATISGWGMTVDDGNLSPILNYVSVPIISNEECALTYGEEVITSSILCTWTKDLKGPCLGDGGGALHIKECDNIPTQIGIDSFGATPCVEYPAGYTRVSSYLDWISNITGLDIRL